MAVIEKAFTWTTRDRWLWPSDDVKLLQVIDDVADVDKIMQFLPNIAEGAVCVQAGGACGVWPARLAKDFERVYTFEPVAENMLCLKKNIEGMLNVVPTFGALGNPDASCGEVQHVGMGQHPNERHNAGSMQVKYVARLNDQTLPADFLPLLCGIDMDILPVLGPAEHLAAILLDVEGFELEAIKGAQQAIDRFRPLIVVEDKGLSTRYNVPKGAVVDYLKARGYRVAASIKRDVVLVHEDGGRIP
jgi:hypothetical protein